jgi:hypothetical protein
MLCGIKYRPIVWIIRRRQRIPMGWVEIGWEWMDGIGLDGRRWDKTKHPVIEG